MKSVLKKIGHRISDISNDSRHIKNNSLFLAYPGLHNDGRTYIEAAIKKGAKIILYEKKNFVWKKTWHTEHYAVSELKNKEGEIAHTFFKKPSKQILTIGITGTNGKTSCAYWTAEIQNLLGKKTGVIGTLGFGYKKLKSHTYTTPDAISNHRILRQFKNQKIKSAVMEVSSHALSQGRVNGILFDIAVFTNLSRDHLDYHLNFRNYFNEKKKLFEFPSLKVAVINIDDSYGKKLKNFLVKNKTKVLSYGIKSGDIKATHIEYSNSSTRFQIAYKKETYKVEAPVVGEFNVYNLLAVITSLIASGNSIKKIVKQISYISQVPGRMERLRSKNTPNIFIDYAHTPDALKKVLQTLKNQTDGNLICVFGCGGDRDAGKRKDMAEIASNLADINFITSDNPRNESPGKIIKEISKHMKGSYCIEFDRHKAIEKAIMNAKKDDVVLIAGKGHETYQEIKGIKHPFSDQTCARKALKVYKAS
ncbi:UDP-N-acetylmuramoyl-L-alanyl-D-glutamate--2,6-diaminopimelate ligase [Candidatus Methylopumilus planktonicus]|uniref:UDP-N-acetylmuramoyl-L-alanyl-D-glutamate--2, 6-diaminopimelate ligase n=1 Tax=Candidatus Methylopumilus planktonicus TaxID=1581557 RepID=UPI003BEEE657